MWEYAEYGMSDLWLGIWNAELGSRNVEWWMRVLECGMGDFLLSWVSNLWLWLSGMSDLWLGMWNMECRIGDSECGMMDGWNEWFVTWNIGCRIGDSECGMMDAGMECGMGDFLLVMWNRWFCWADLACGIWNERFGTCNMECGMRDVILGMWNMEWVMLFL